MFKKGVIMAVIITDKGKMIQVSPEQGLLIWQIFTGRKIGTDQQMKYCENIKNVYLNARSKKTPKEYLQERKHLINS